MLARDTAQAKNAAAAAGALRGPLQPGAHPARSVRDAAATATALEATLAADQAQVENAQLNLQYTRIVAPISGRTGALSVHQGDLVRANDTTPLVVINQVAPIYVSFSVPGRYLPEIRRCQAQQPLVIEARMQAWRHSGRPAGGAGDGRQHFRGWRRCRKAGRRSRALGVTRESGKVTFIDNTVDATTGTIKMKGTFQNADHGLWPGSSCR